jgi:putative ABC transport system permease protein
MVSALARKAFRDLWHFRGQMLAVAAVVTCGTTSMVAMRGAMSQSLAASQATFYAAGRFADVFAHVRRAPESVLRNVRAIPGVAQVESRLVTDVLLDVPGLTEPATGHLVTLPDRLPPLLNAVYLRAGRPFAPGASGEAIASEAFAEANHLRAGDRIGALINGRWQELSIVGIGLSPEFVYEVPPGDLFPDKRRYGVLWLSREQLAPPLSMEGAFNDLTLTLTPGASEPEVIANLDRLLDSYGGLGAYGRHDQVSNRFLSDEIRQHEVMGFVIGYLFLGVAAFLLNVILGRVVGSQRDQIGVLKAFGYSNARVAVHYLRFALAPVALGALAGCLLGAWLGGLIADVFAQFYRFPQLLHVTSPQVFVVATGVSLVSATLGTAGALRRAFRLPPAEAMRPDAPAATRHGVLDALPLSRLGPAARMVVRNIARRPGRAVFTTVGVAFAVSLLVVGRYFFDAFDYMTDLEFRHIEQQDATVTFAEARASEVRFDLARLPGVLAVEPFRAVPVRLRHEHYRYRLALQGLPADGSLRRMLDRQARPVALPSRGVLLSSQLATILHVRTGDTVTVEVLEGRRPIRAMLVAGTVDELLGLGAYLRLDELGRMLEEGPTVSGARLSVDPARSSQLYRTLKRIPAVATVSVREAAIQSFNETVAGSMRISTRVMLVFAAVIAVAVVYNAARIALSERGRELASLRVLGFTRGEVALVLFGELGILTLIGLPLGGLLGIGICATMPTAFNTDLYRLPLVITGRTQLFADAVVLLAAMATLLVVRRRLNRLDLVAVLKTRE